MKFKPHYSLDSCSIPKHPSEPHCIADAATAAIAATTTTFQFGDLKLLLFSAAFEWVERGGFAIQQRATKLEEDNNRQS